MCSLSPKSRASSYEKEVATTQEMERKTRTAATLANLSRVPAGNRCCSPCAANIISSSLQAPSRSETLPCCHVEIMGAQRGEAPHHTGAKMPTQIGLGGACPDLWPYVMLPHSITCYHSIGAAVQKPWPWPFLYPFIADINFGR